MRKIWLDGELLDRDQAKISVYDHGLLYGDGCFEGIRVYGGRIMKLGTHLSRLYRSAELLYLAPPYTKEEIEVAIRQTVVANGLSDGYIRLVLTRGVGSLGLNPFKCPRATVFIIVDTIELYPKALYETGMGVIIAQRTRIPTRALDPSVKSLNYLNNILAKVEAIRAGVLEAIMLNEQGNVSECTGDNIFLVQGRKLVTPSTDAGILHGVTRSFVLDDLAPSVGLAVEERMVAPDEVFTSDEIFLTGTAAEIIGVVRVDDRAIGQGTVGAVTKQLTAAFRQRIADGVPEN